MDDSATPASLPSSGMDRVSLGLITLGHGFVDLNQGVVVALLPFLVASGELTYQAGGGLVFATSAASSIVQPLFGHLSDRLSSRWLLPASVLVTGLGLAAASMISTYWLMAALLGLSGLGVAAFHPDAARQARRASGLRASTGMSIFAVGGGLGFASAPLLTPAILGSLGRDGIAWLLVPATFVMGCILLARFRGTVTPRSGHGSDLTSTWKDDWPAFLLLSVAVMARSVVFAGLNTFLALYWMAKYSTTPAEGNLALGLFLGAGLIGTLLGGLIGDRFGRRLVMRGGFLLAAALLPIMLACSEGWALVVLLPLAVAFAVPWSVMMVLGQEYLPARIGMASGVTLGLSVSVGGMMAPVLGRVADLHGTGTVMTILEGLLIAVTALAFLLPNPRRIAAQPVATV